MTSVAVVAHSGKTVGGGLAELRAVLAAHGVEDPMWFEVDKSRKAPKRALEAVERGADLIFVWGGDGSVQRCLDVLVGSAATVAIVPAGTANLLATNLRIPKDIEAAVRIGLDGADYRMDLGRVNGEHFAVMAGSGLDALMISDTPKSRKLKFGRAAYIVSAARRVRDAPVKTKVKVDGHTWFDGDASCVLVGNVGDIIGGVTAFDHARPDDGKLDVAVVTATGVWQWARTLTRAAVGRTDRSPLVQMTVGTTIDVRTKSAHPYELDGGARKKSDHLKIEVVPGAIVIRVPAA